MRSSQLTKQPRIYKTRDGLVLYSTLINRTTRKEVMGCQEGGIKLTYKDVHRILSSPEENPQLTIGILEFLGHSENLDSFGFKPDEASKVIDLVTNVLVGQFEAKAQQALQTLSAKYSPAAPSFRPARTMVAYKERPGPIAPEDEYASAAGEINGAKVNGKTARGIYIDEKSPIIAILEGKDLAQLNSLLPELKVKGFDVATSLEKRFKTAMEAIIADPNLSEIRGTAKEILEQFEIKKAAASTDSRVTAPAIPPVKTPERVETEKDALFVLMDSTLDVPSTISEDNIINQAYTFLLRQKEFSFREALVAASMRFKNTPLHAYHAGLVARIAAVTNAEGLTGELLEVLELRLPRDKDTQIIIATAIKRTAANIARGRVAFEDIDQIDRAINALTPYSSDPKVSPALSWLSAAKEKMQEPAPRPDVDASIADRVERAFKEFGEKPERPVAAEAPRRDTWKGVTAPEPTPEPVPAAPVPAPQPAAPAEPLTEAQITEILSRPFDKGQISEAMQALSEILDKDGKIENPTHIIFALKAYADSKMPFIKSFSTNLAARIALLQQNADLERKLQAASSRLEKVRGQHTLTKEERDKRIAEIKRLKDALAAQEAAAESSAANEQQAVSQVQALEAQLASASRSNETLGSDKKALEELLAEATSKASVEPLMKQAQALKSRLDGILSNLGAAETHKAELTRSLEKIDKDIMVLQTVAEEITSNYNQQVTEENSRFANEDKKFGTPIDNLMQSLSKEEAQVWKARRAAAMAPYKEAHEKRLDEIESLQKQALANIEAEVADLRGQAEKINQSLEANEIKISKAEGERSDVQTEVFELQREIDKVQTGLDGTKGLAANISTRASYDKKV